MTSDEIVRRPSSVVRSSVHTLREARGRLFQRANVPTLPLLLLVALALVRGALYAAVVPPWQAPDETGHFEYVWLLAHLRRVPVREDASPGFEGQLIDSLYRYRFGDYSGRPLPEEPPERLDGLPRWSFARLARTVRAERFSLGYALQALATVPSLHKGLEAQLYAARLSSVALNAWIVVAAYLTARLLFPRRGCPFAAASARACNSAGSDNPANPAMLAFSMPRRSTSTSPSRCRAWRFVKA